MVPVSNCFYKMVVEMAFFWKEQTFLEGLNALMMCKRENFL